MGLPDNEIEFHKEWLNLFNEIECSKWDCKMNDYTFEAYIRVHNEQFLIDIRCWDCGKYIIKNGLLPARKETFDVWQEEKIRQWFKITKSFSNGDSSLKVSSCDPGIYGNGKRLNQLDQLNQEDQ